MRQLLIATHNPGKVREYRALLADLPLTLVGLDAVGITTELEETGSTFAENAILKAEGYAAQSGLWTWADDSGLEVDALDGRPGVYSARYGGPGLDDAGRVRFLLAQLEQAADRPRTARFRCVVALARPPAPTQTTAGVLEGEIATSPRGEHGFGYDPVFYLPDRGMTLAEATPTLKNQISHRAQAAQAAKALLRAQLG